MIWWPELSLSEIMLTCCFCISINQLEILSPQLCKLSKNFAETLTENEMIVWLRFRWKLCIPFSCRIKFNVCIGTINNDRYILLSFKTEGQVKLNPLLYALSLTIWWTMLILCTWSLKEQVLSLKVLSCSWSFFATSHGISSRDGIGGTIKWLAARASLQKPLNNQILKLVDLKSWEKISFKLHKIISLYSGYKSSNKSLLNAESKNRHIISLLRVLPKHATQ